MLLQAFKKEKSRIKTQIVILCKKTKRFGHIEAPKGRSALGKAGAFGLAIVPTHLYCLPFPVPLTATSCVALRPLSWSL